MLPYPLRNSVPSFNFIVLQSSDTVLLMMFLLVLVSYSPMLPQESVKNSLLSNGSSWIG